MGDITLVEMGGLVLGLLLTGVLAGVLAGLLGVGGGIVVVPVLFYVFALLAIDPAVRMHLAVGTSLAIIVPTSLRSARSHYHAGTVDTGLLRDLGLSLLAGVLLGVALSAMVSGRLLTAVFGIMAVLVAINMARTGGPPRITGTPPRGALRHGIGAFIGSVSTMMGIGGGTLSVPTLDALGYPIRRSIGNGCRHWYHHFGAGRGWFHHVIHYVQADYLRGVRQSPRRFLQAPRGNFRGCHQYPPWRWWFTGRSAYGFDPSGRCR